MGEDGKHVKVIIFRATRTILPLNLRGCQRDPVVFQGTCRIPRATLSSTQICLLLPAPMPASQGRRAPEAGADLVMTS